MSTNYNALLSSEKKLKKIIVEYLVIVYKIHSKLWNELDQAESFDIHPIYDNVERRIKKAWIMEEELIDECIWTISKDQPRANHLRFIISIIYCAKDLTRASEYSQSISKIILRKKISKKHISYLKPIIKLYLNIIDKIVEIYSSKIEDKLEKFDEINLEFEDKMEKNEKEIREKIKNIDNEIIYIHLSQIIRLISSTIERIKTVFPSTVFINSITSIHSIKKNND